MNILPVILILCVLLLVFLLFQCVRFPAKTKSTRRFRVLVLMVLSGIALACFLKEYGPRGRNSLFSEAGEGKNSGEDMKELNEGAPEDGDAPVTVIISGDQVTVGGRSFYFTDDSDDGFLEYVSGTIKEDASVRLIDSYALAGTYRKVRKTFEALGITPVELSE